MNYNINELPRKLDELGIYSLIDIVTNILDRIDNPNDDEDIFQAIDDEIIYYDDQWKIIKAYCNPTTANWEFAIEEFTSAIFSLTSLLSKED